MLGILCHGVYNICYSIAVTTIGVALSAVLLDIAPLFTLLFSVLFFQEKVTFLKGIAVIINIIGCILKYLPYGPQFYDEDTITDQPERAIVAEIIREKALHALDDEIPHGIAVYIDRMKGRKGQNIIDIDATIVCERDSHKGIIIGKGGAMLKKIGSNARYEIERLLDTKVNLKLWVKVKKDWRDSDFLIKNFGYNKDEI